MTLGFRPQLPTTVIDVVAGLGALTAALSLGSFINHIFIRS